MKQYTHTHTHTVVSTWVEIGTDMLAITRIPDLGGYTVNMK